MERPGTASSWREGAREQAKVDGREIQIFQQQQVPMLGESTYAAEYKRWATQPERVQSAKKREDRAASAGPFEGNSTYRAQFPWRPVTPATPRAKGPPSRFEPQDHVAPIQSTYNMAYTAMPYARAASFKPHDKREPPGTVPFAGRSTYADAYQPHGVVERPATAKAEQRPQTPQPFEGRSTYADAYRAFGVQPRVAGRKPADEREHKPARFEGTSAHREHFKVVRLPEGVSYELGVQVVGGRFYHMIPRGARPPKEGRATFTTVLDYQETVEIVVVGRQKEGRGQQRDIELGHFELGGIMPNAAGIPQIVVTYHLLDDLRLRVTALDKQRNHTTQMTCRQLR